MNGAPPDPETDAMCPQCGAALPAKVLGGCCARCMARLAVLPLTPPPEVDDPVEDDDESDGAFGTIGDYELRQTIARGGSGVVFKARQRSLNRTVALKMLVSGQFAATEEVRRFRAEAEAAAHLDHPGIVPVYEVGEHDGRPFFSMKFVEGGSLAGRGRVPPRAAAALIAKAALAVHYAHQRGFIHRDLKPGNILLDAAGEPMVADFGLARRLDAALALTLPGAALGTPAYMAPEQIEPQGPPTVAVDIYGLGAVLYELLGGRPPFEHPTLSGLFLAVKEKDPAALAVPRDLMLVCRKCLEKDPVRRYATAHELAADLRCWLAGEPVSARAFGKLERTWTWCRRHPARAIAIALLALLAAGSTVAAWQISVARKAESSALASARAQLRESLLAQARAGRLSGEPGARFVGLVALQRANAIAPGRDVLDETIAHLVMTGLGEPEIFCAHPHGELRTDPFTSAVSHDGTRGAWVVGNDIIVRELRSGSEIVRVPGASKAARVDWSPDDQWLGIEYPDGCAAWSFAERKPIVRGGVPAGAFGKKCAFSPDGCTFAVAERTDSEDAVRVFVLPSGEVLHTVPPDHPCGSVALADGKPWLVMRGRHRALVRDYQKDAWVLDASPEFRSRIFSLALAPDDSSAAWGSENGSLFFAGLDPPLETSRHFIYHSDRTALIDLSYAPDSRMVAATAWESSTRLWDAHTGVRLADSRQGFARGFTRDGRLSFFRPDGIGLWPVADGSPVYQNVTAGVNRTLGAHALGFSPDSRWIVGNSLTSTPDGSWLSDEDPGMSLALYHLSSHERRTVPLPAPLRRGASSSDGRFFCAVIKEAILRWPLGTAHGLGEMERWDVPAISDRPASILSSPDGRWVIVRVPHKSTGPTDTLELLRVELASPPRVTSLISNIRFKSTALRPDGARLVIGDLENDGGSLVLDTPTGRVVHRFAEPGERPAFSPDGRWLVMSGLADDRVLDATTFTEIIRLPLAIATYAVRSAAVSTSAHLLARRSGEDTIELFDSRTWRSLASLRLPAWSAGRGRFMERISFSPNGEYLALWGGRDTHLWHLPSLQTELAKLGLRW